MMVNQIQVGGRHYKDRQLQPWDLDRYGVGGLEWTAIKYVSRYREKDGLVDLRKAEHYVMKIIEEFTVHNRHNRCPSLAVSREAAGEYIEQWQLPLTEAAIVSVLIGWRDVRSLQLALGYVRELMTAYADTLVREHGEKQP